MDEDELGNVPEESDSGEGVEVPDYTSDEIAAFVDRSNETDSDISNLDGVAVTIEQEVTVDDETVTIVIPSAVIDDDIYASESDDPDTQDFEIEDVTPDEGEDVTPEPVSEAIYIPTVAAVTAGERVAVMIQDGIPMVIGGAGYGDAVAADIAATNTIAEEAQAVANATNQHFFSDDAGVHVTEKEGQADTAHNILINSVGILLRSALNHLVSITKSAIAFFDGDGNLASNIVARFGKDGAQIGKSNESHVALDYHSLKLVDKEGNEYFYVSDLRDAEGVAEIVVTFTGDGSTRSFDLSPAASDTDYTVTVSDSSGGTVYKQTGFVSFETAPTDGATITVTYETDDPTAKAFTFGSRGTGNIGAVSFAAGRSVVASASLSHAEGERSNASGMGSHAEGYQSVAAGRYSHAEGASAAYGNYAHADGFLTFANGLYSHAQNLGTRAASIAQSVLGKYNEEDANGTYALIIGNGTSNSNRSNALTVQWDGTVEMGTDVPWTLLTLDSACHAYNDVSANAPRYRRWGQLVTVQGIIAPTAEVAAGGNMAIATLPAGVRPHQQINVKCQGSGRAHWCLNVTAAGVMTASRYGDENGAQAMATSFWMPFTVTYLV